MRDAFDKVGGAIQRINNPLEFAVIITVIAMLFANNTVGWEGFL